MTTETQTNSQRIKQYTPPWGKYRRLSDREYSKDALLDGIEQEIKRLWWWLQTQRKGVVGWHVPTDNEPMKRSTREALTSLLAIRAGGQGRIDYWTRHEMAEMAADLEREWRDDSQHYCENPLCLIDGDPRDTSAVR